MNTFIINGTGTEEENGRSLLETIEKCKENGGGNIVVSAGKYAVASIRLFSNMTLYLKSGAELSASTNWKDYTDFHVPTTMEYVHSPRMIKAWNLPPHYLNAVITVIESEHVRIIGEKGSLINGNDCFDPNGEEKFRGPMGIVICKCTDVILQGYTFIHSSNWSHQLDSCQNVKIKDVTVLAGHDGFNVHHCENVRIEHCHLETGDDCFAGYDARNVYITDCYCNTSCNGFRYGGENLLVENCIFEGPGTYPHRVSGRHNMLYAFEYYSLQDDVIRSESRNWLITGCTFRNMDGFIHYEFGDENEHQTNKPLRDITVENFKICGMKKTSTFFGGKGVYATAVFSHGTIDLTQMDTPVFIKTDGNSRTIFQDVSVTGGVLEA